MNLLSTGFLSSSTTDVWARASFAVGGCPVHCRCSTAPLVSTHWMSAESLLLVVTTKTVCRYSPPDPALVGNQ